MKTLLHQIRYVLTGERCEVVKAADLAHDRYEAEQKKTRYALKTLMNEAVAMHNERVMADWSSAR